MKYLSHLQKYKRHVQEYCIFLSRGICPKLQKAHLCVQAERSLASSSQSDPKKPGSKSEAIARAEAKIIEAKSKSLDGFLEVFQHAISDQGPSDTAGKVNEIVGHLTGAMLRHGIIAEAPADRNPIMLAAKGKIPVPTGWLG